MKYNITRYKYQQIRKQVVTFLENLKDYSFKYMGHADPKVKSNNINGTHWIAIPNVKPFRFKLKNWNSVLELLGIKKRNSPEMEWEAYYNKKYNLYMHRQIKRLRSFKNNTQKIFSISRFLMSRSKIFRASAINKGFPNWYKTLPLNYVLNINRKVNKILKQNLTNLYSKRVYITKGNSHRPLGVPKTE